jgi:hypothetical protein
VFINEQNIMFEACIQMWLKAKMNYDRIVVAVDVSVDTVQSLEELS